MTPLRVLCLLVIPVVSARLLVPWVSNGSKRLLQSILPRRPTASWKQQHAPWSTLPRGGASTEQSIAPALPDAPQKDNVISTTSSAVTDQLLSPQQRQMDDSSLVPPWKQSLPAALREKGPKSLQKLCMGNTDIYLLGTAHVSNDSSVDVDLLLQAVHPDVVFVELCESRIPLLEGLEDTAALNNNETASDMGFWDRLRSVQQEHGCSQLQAMSTVMLTSVQADYAKELEVELGGEFRRAYEYWRQQRGGRQQPRLCRLILGDRPMHVTVMRAWESLGFFAKIKVVFGLLWSSFQKPNKKDLLEWLDAVRREESDVLTESMAELRKHLPSVYLTIIHERDLYLAAKLVQVCRGLQYVQLMGQRSTIVAIVGAGHMPGIIGHLTNSTQQQSPEQVLADLVMTRRMAKDPAMKEVVASWVNDVTELQEMPDASFQWAQPEGLMDATVPAVSNELRAAEVHAPSS